MTNHTIKKQPKSTVEIMLIIPKATVAAEYEKAFIHELKEFEAEGFRKGKVPRVIAEKQIAKDKVYQKALQTMLPGIYENIVKEEKLQPIISPKIELLEAKEGEDWKLKMTVAEKPEIKLKNYKDAIKKAKAEVKAADIWVPGKEEKKEESDEVKSQRQLNKVLEAVLTSVECEISDVIIAEELDRRLTQLVDEVQKIGLTIESYLKSKSTTIEKIREQFTKEITDMYRLEFILAEIADQEGVKVEQADLDKLFASAKTDKEKKLAQQNAYMYASILRKQKTLDSLNSL